jgi:hypothetical protein
MVFVIKIYLFLHFKRLYKKIKNIFFYFKLIYFFCIFGWFWHANIKNNFKKTKKKHYFNIFLGEKHFDKHPLSHSQTPPKKNPNDAIDWLC